MAGSTPSRPTWRPTGEVLTTGRERLAGRARLANDPWLQLSRGKMTAE